MAVTININGLTLVHKDSDGVAKATLPDVCLTPTPNGPVRRNYPNTAYSKNLAKGTVTVFADGGHMCAHKDSEFSKSEGDEAGSVGGVISGTNLAEATWITYSPNVFIEGKNACRLTDKMLMNHGNTACLAGEQQPDLSEEKKDCDSDDPPPLEEFDQDIGGYSKEELNDATKTTFGEISPYIHDKIDEEAEAVVSTIMNRKTLIYESRAAFDTAVSVVQTAQSNYNAAGAYKADLTGHPTSYKKEFGSEVYAAKVDQATESYHASRRELVSAQRAQTSAANVKIEAESYLVDENTVNKKIVMSKENPTLSDIVSPNKQYEGTEKGNGYYHSCPVYFLIKSASYNSSFLKIVKL